MTTIIEDKYIPFGVLDTLSHDGNRFSFLPYGDYVQTPEGLDFYSFLVTPLDGTPHAFVGGTIGDVNALLTDTVKQPLGAFTLYYPLSLI